MQLDLSTTLSLKTTATETKSSSCTISKSTLTYVRSFSNASVFVNIVTTEPNNASLWFVWLRSLASSSTCLSSMTPTVVATSIISAAFCAEISFDGS